MSVPGDRNKTLKRVESSLNVYLISIFSIDAREYRNYRQRTILVTPMSQDETEQKVKDLAVKIAEQENKENPDEHFKVEVLPNQQFIEKKREQRPQDSSIISIVSPLTIAKRSPKTGRIFYDEEYEFCPETSAALRHVIAVSQNNR